MSDAREVSDTELAYIAGFFDGEGCISGGIERRGYAFLHVSISQKFDTPLLFIQARFGGKIWPCKGRDMYQWHLNGQGALELLRAILPYLMLKRPQAELAIEFLETRTTSGRHYTPVQSARRLALVTEISALKRVG